VKNSVQMKELNDRSGGYEGVRGGRGGGQRPYRKGVRAKRAGNGITGGHRGQSKRISKTQRGPTNYKTSMIQ